MASELPKGRLSGGVWDLKRVSGMLGRSMCPAGKTGVLSV